jgi:transmembrane sensor
MEYKMNIEELITKFYSGKISDEEMAFLLDYLKYENPNAEMLDLYQSIWNEAEDRKADIDSDQLLRQLAAKIGIPDKTSVSSPGSPERISRVSPVRFLNVLRYAAVFFLAFSLSWLIHSYLWKRPALQPVPDADQAQMIEVPYGSKSSIVLPDSSVVILNSGSKLKYSVSDFNSASRSVFLTGEGYFSITKDPERPFYVSTPGIKLKVLGTTFNVKAYPDENTEEATLVTGKVEIYNNSDKSGNDDAIVLKPNQKAVFLKSGSTILADVPEKTSQPVSEVTLKTVRLQPSYQTEQTISWKENKLIFDNEPFSSLVIKIERWYNVNITVDYPELNSVRFTGKFDKETLEQVLNALVTVTPFNYRIKQNNIIISEK